MNQDTIETEIVPSQALAIRPDSSAVAPAGLFGTVEPVAVIEKASAVATALKGVISKQGLISRISGKEYPRCEAWTLLGTMLGVFPVLCWSRPVDGGWEARVEAKTRSGDVIGAAEAQCLRSEKNWANRDDFALRSMAQTRATAKCLRMPLGFVMTLAGFEATPAEEMGYQPARHEPPAFAEPPKAKPATAPAVATAAFRDKMIENLKAGPGGPNRQTVTEFFRKLGPPYALMPDEQMEDLPLRFVPVDKAQMQALTTAIGDFEAGNLAKLPYKPNGAEDDDGDLGPQKPKAAAQRTPKDDEAWRDVIVTIPRKGMKRVDYLKAPDTIGSLYDLRHGSDDEAAAARSRLFGLVSNWDAAPREYNGKTYQPSEGDKKCRAALDAFEEWFEKNHPGEKI